MDDEDDTNAEQELAEEMISRRNVPSLDEIAAQARANNRDIEAAGRKGLWAELDNAQLLKLVNTAAFPPDHPNGLKNKEFAHFARTRMGIGSTKANKLILLADFADDIKRDCESDRRKAEARGESYEYPAWNFFWRKIKPKKEKPPSSD